MLRNKIYSICMPIRRRYIKRRPIKKTVSATAKQLHSHLVAQATRNHEYHSTGLRQSETQLQNLGVPQKSSIVEKTSSTAKAHVGKWIDRIVEEALLGAVIAA